MSTFDSQAFLSTLTHRPGVYQMFDESGELIYVGKAKHLKNRVSSYFRARGLNSKTVALVSRINSIEVIVTQSETEALILEQTLIKKHRPKYNILLKDDKSYPLIHLSEDEFPLLAYRRGKRSKKGRYFGPFPNASAVKQSLNHLQKIFKIRSCENSYFNNRSRPCLQYQIKRCTAPCVDLVSKEEYAEQINHAVMLLQGKNRELLRLLDSEMEQASASLEFEKAAELRDQAQHLRVLQEQQYVSVESHGRIDAWGVLQQSGVIAFHRLSMKDGQLNDSKTYLQTNKLDQSSEELTPHFLAQYYLSSDIDALPNEIILSEQQFQTSHAKSNAEESNAGESDADEQDEGREKSLKQEVVLILEAIAEHFELPKNRIPKLISSPRQEKKAWASLSFENAKQALVSKQQKQTEGKEKLEKVAELFELPSLPNRIECFDISHSKGESTVASCVVFNSEGAAKDQYRRFNIKDVEAGDDYAAIHQAVYRRFARLKEQEDLPDLLLIDGGRGQLAKAQQALDELEITQTEVTSISKAVTRKAGWEFLWQVGREKPLQPNPHNGGFLLLQEIRDEAHRFAITGHRKQRAKARVSSGLEGIAGVGPKRRKALMQFFGGMAAIKGASMQELAKVDGISDKVAEDIYVALHGTIE